MNSITRVDTYDPKVLNTAEAAKALSISESTLTRMRQRRILRTQAMARRGVDEPPEPPPMGTADSGSYARCIGPRFVRFGKKVFYRQDDLDEWIKNPV